MRHSVIITVLLSALACLCGCTAGTPEIRHINIVSHPFEWADTAEVIIGNPLQMLRFDSIVVVRDDVGDSLFHIISVPSGRYYGQFGRIGQGPGEFSENTFLVKSGKNGIELFDRIKQTLYEANLMPGNKLELSYRPLAALDGRESSMVTGVVGDRYVSTTAYSDHRELMAFFSSSGKLLGRYGDRCFGDQLSDLPARTLTAAYQGQIMVNLRGDRIAAFIDYSEVAGFYKIEGDSLVQVAQVCNARPCAVFSGKKYKGLKTDEPLRFVSGTCDDDHVYILYSDRCIDDGPFTAATGNRILVYTWSGEQVAELHTDVRVRHFTAPDSTGRMYALTQDGCDPTLIYFDIPAI